MTPEQSIVKIKRSDSQPHDPIIYILIVLCLAIVYSSWPANNPNQNHSSSLGHHRLIWDNYAFVISNGEHPPETNQLPAHKAPFLFQNINVNQSDSALLQIIPGIGPELAQRIIEKRDELGGFSMPEQLLSVSGIGNKRKEKLIEWLAFE